MGLLFDRSYWSHAANEMFDIRPVPDRTMSREDTGKFLGLACKCLTDLLQDGELNGDLESVANLVGQYGANVPLSDVAEFEHFLEEFSRAEMALLTCSGLKLESAYDIVKELRHAALFSREIKPDAVIKFRDELGPLREKICAGEAMARDSIESGARRRSIWRTIKGCAAIGLDGAGGAVAQWLFPAFGGPIALATFSAASIGWGTTMIARER